MLEDTNKLKVSSYNKVKASEDSDKYMGEWFKVNNILEDNGMTWAMNLEETMESNYQFEEWCQYVSLSSVKIKKSSYLECLNATRNLFKLLTESVDKFYNLDRDEKIKILKDLNFSKYYQELILESPKLKLISYLCRFDLVLGKDNKVKCIEFNSDTPLGLVESGMVHSVVNDYNRLPVYNRVEYNLIRMWDTLRKNLNMSDDDIIYFSSIENGTEDRLTTEYNRIHSQHKGKSKFVALEDIIVKEDGLYTKDNNKIKYWYRIYPLEFWENEVDNLGIKLSEFIRNGELVMINPVTSFLIQNKLFYSYLYSQLENNQLDLSQESLETIDKYLLKTYKGEKKDLTDYVEKPIYGREGNCVDIYINNKLVYKDKEHTDTKYYRSQDKIYQEYFEMPDAVVECWDGEYKGKMLIGSYSIGGEASGLYIRVGDMVTGPLSLCCSYVIEEDIK